MLHMDKSKLNIDIKTVDGFGDEWSRFDQSRLSADEGQRLFDDYFSIFPWDTLPLASEGFDLGCGSGRWAKLFASRRGDVTLHCIDPSSAIEVARFNLQGHGNFHFHRAGVDQMPFANQSMDFGYSLGVLHHIPDTQAALTSCVEKLKPGAPFLLYVYYKLDGRPSWFRFLWKVSELIRGVVSRCPHGLRYVITQVIAAIVYWPLARLAVLLESLGVDITDFPLASYRNLSFYVMRTDALDRFGTRLEQRFSKNEIQQMMESAGLVGIVFREAAPFWCAVGFARVNI
jgi:SAM-dependent methyltransferase